MKTLLPFLLVSLTACMNANMDADVPKPPDMTALLQSYQAPTAPFKDSSLEDITALASQAAELFNAADGLAPIFNTIDSSSQESQQQALHPSPNSESATLEQKELAVEVAGQDVEGNGYAEIVRICPGWTASAPPDQEQNGSVKLTLVFSDTGIEPVIWGTAKNCRYLAQGRQLLIDGEVKIHTGEVLDSFWSPEGPTTPTTTQAILASFDGTITLDGEPLLKGAFDFRLLISHGRLEFNLSTPNGNLLFFTQETAQGFIASDGTWFCDFSTMECIKQ